MPNPNVRKPMALRKHRHDVMTEKELIEGLLILGFLFAVFYLICGG